VLESTPVSEAQDQDEQKIYYKQGMEAEMEQVGAGIVTARWKNLTRARIHCGVFTLPFRGGAENIGNVPHRYC